MKKHFFTGLVILLPFALTIIIVSFVINFITTPFQGLVEYTLHQYDILDQPFLFLSGKQVIMIWSKILVLTAVLCSLVLIGLLAQKLILTKLFQLGELIIHKVPLVGAIYKATKGMTRSFFDTQTSSFSRVALVPFPYPGAYSIGLISQDSLEKGHFDTINVFVPTIPNLTFGYTILIKNEDLHLIDMKVEDALKCIVSCGIIFPNFNINGSSEKFPKTQ